MHRSSLVLAAVVALGSRPVYAAPVRAGEAARDAALVVIALKQTRTVESRESVLARAFDSSTTRAPLLAPDAIPGDFTRRKNWFIPVYNGKLAVDDPVEEVAPPSAVQTPDDPLGRAFQAAMAPWQTLLEAAWGGAWKLAPVRMLAPQAGQ